MKKRIEMRQDSGRAVFNGFYDDYRKKYINSNYLNI